MRKCLFVGVTAALLLTVAALGADEEKARAVAWRQTKDLDVEAVGPVIGCPFVRLLSLVQAPDGRWMQPISYRANRRTVYFCTLDLQAGTIKRHDFTWKDPKSGEMQQGDHLPAKEIWSQVVHDGKLYLGYNVPPWFVVYDPATDTVRNLGKAFDKAITVARLSLGPGGMVLCAGTTGRAEVSVYDPASGALTKYGSLSDEHTYAYSAGMSADWIYAACRGKAPWALVALHRKTREKRVLLRAPAAGYLKVSGADRAYVQDPAKQQTQWYRLGDGKAEPFDPKLRQAKPQRAAPPLPEVLCDSDTVYTEGKLTIHYRLPADRPAQEDPNAAPETQGWRKAQIDMGIEGKLVRQLYRWDDHTLIGESGPYGPLFRYDVKADKFEVLGLPTHISVNSVGRSGDRLYLSGYPSTVFVQADLSRPFTSAEGVPGRPSVPYDSPKSNPRRIVYFGNVDQMHGHAGVAMAIGPDGKIWVAAMKFRYFRGFDLCWFDPATGKYGVVDDKGVLDHLQICWMTPVNNGTQVAITTRIEPNDQVEGEVPAAAKLIIFDMRTGEYVRTYTPFPKETALLTVVEVAEGMLVGLVTKPQADRTIIYKFDLDKGKVIQQVKYEGIIAGVPGLNRIPISGPSFKVGPDGHVWTLFRLGSVRGYPGLLIRIDPKTLRVAPVGRIGAMGRTFLFVGRDIYLAGEPQLRRVRNVVPEK